MTTLKVNPDFVAVPPGVVTLILPDAPEATTAFIVVELTTVNDVAAIPPRLTEVAPVKFVPVTIIVSPVEALVGENEIIVGTEVNVKIIEDAVPPGVVTFIFPVAPVPTMAVMVLSLTIINDEAATPPKVTAVVPVKFLPVIVTVVPIPPLIGVKDAIEGANT